MSLKPLELIQDELGRSLRGTTVQYFPSRFDTVTERGTIRVALQGSERGPFLVSISINNEWNWICEDRDGLVVRRSSLSNPGVTGGEWILPDFDALMRFLRRAAEFLDRILPVETPEPASRAEGLWSIGEADLGTADLHVITCRDLMRREISAKVGKVVNMEDVYRYNSERFEIPLEVARRLRLNEELSFQVMDLAMAWLGVKFPEAPLELCSAVAQAIGELAGGDAAFGPPERQWRGVYKRACHIVTRFPNAALSAEGTKAALAAVLQSCMR